jgi:hypothetical protein
LLSPSPAAITASLIPASGYPGRHDFAVRLMRIRLLRLLRPPHLLTSVSDDRETPLMRAEDARKSAVDLPVVTSKTARGILARRANQLTGGKDVSGQFSCPGRGAAPSARSRASSTRYGAAPQSRDLYKDEDLLDAEMMDPGSAAHHAAFAAHCAASGESGRRSFVGTKINPA